MSNFIDEKIIAKVAKLAHIDLCEEERSAFAIDLQQILEWVGQLEEVDSSKTKPLAHPVELSPVMREDIVEEPISVEDVLKNAPEKQSGFFVTPKTNE